MHYGLADEEMRAKERMSQVDGRVVRNCSSARSSFAFTI